MRPWRPPSGPASGKPADRPQARRKFVVAGHPSSPSPTWLDDAMHRIVGELESAGLVARHPDPDHGRIRRTRLTDDGRARVADCRPDVDLVQDRMLSDLSSPETAQLGDFLARCLAALRDD